MTKLDKLVEAFMGLTEVSTGYAMKKVVGRMERSIKAGARSSKDMGPLRTQVNMGTIMGRAMEKAGAPIGDEPGNVLKIMKQHASPEMKANLGSMFRKGKKEAKKLGVRMK